MGSPRQQHRAVDERPRAAHSVYRLTWKSFGHFENWCLSRHRDGREFLGAGTASDFRDFDLAPHGRVKKSSRSRKADDLIRKRGSRLRPGALDASMDFDSMAYCRRRQDGRTSTRAVQAGRRRDAAGDGQVVRKCSPGHQPRVRLNAAITRGSDGSALEGAPAGACGAQVG